MVKIWAHLPLRPHMPSFSPTRTEMERFLRAFTEPSLSTANEQATPFSVGQSAHLYVAHTSWKTTFPEEGQSRGGSLVSTGNFSIGVVFSNVLMRATAPMATSISVQVVTVVVIVCAKLDRLNSATPVNPPVFFPRNWTVTTTTTVARPATTRSSTRVSHRWTQ